MTTRSVLRPKLGLAGFDSLLSASLFILGSFIVGFVRFLTLIFLDEKQDRSHTSNNRSTAMNKIYNTLKATADTVFAIGASMIAGAGWA